METARQEPQLQQIVPGVHAWIQPDGTWWVNNTGVIAGVDAVVLVDTCATATRTRSLLAAVERTCPGLPIRFAVNTHQHGDHTYGNSLLPEATVVVGHEAMRAGLASDPIIDGCPPFWSPVPDWGDVTRRLPSLTLRSELTLFAGGRRVEVRHPGYAAHTTGDVVVWLPDERVLFTGDLLFHGLTPLVFMGSVDGARESLAWIDGFSPDHVVPGHGPRLTGAELPGVLAAHERYYRFVADVASTGLASGLDPLAAARAADLGEFAGWADAERLVLNLHRAYADAAGTELDLPAAFTDAVAWNGGPLSTSV